MRRPKRYSSRSRYDDDTAADSLMTIPEFCEWAKISRRTYDLRRKDGLGPREIRLGGRVIRIAREEALAWSKRMTGGGA
jgi:predicted DNA-binding transcriptional regulator AlpA